MSIPPSKKTDSRGLTFKQSSRGFTATFLDPVSDVKSLDFAFDPNLTNSFSTIIKETDGNQSEFIHSLENGMVTNKANAFQPFLLTYNDDSADTNQIILDSNEHQLSTDFSNDSSDDELKKESHDNKEAMKTIDLDLQSFSPLLIENERNGLRNCSIERNEDTFIQNDPSKRGLLIQTEEVFEQLPSYMYDDGYLSSDNECGQNIHRASVNQLHFLRETQKPLQNCCVCCDMKGMFQPLFTIFSQRNPKPKIHWMSFSGFVLSPFDAPPICIDDYLKKSKKTAFAKQKPVSDEAIKVNFCDICKTKYDNPEQHRKSEQHKKCAENYNWSDLDSLINKINSNFEFD